MPARKSWTEGLSATSVGRFGGWDKMYVHKINGLLGLSAGINELYAGGDRSINLGRYEPGQPWSASSETDWVCLRHQMRAVNGKTLARVYQSLLSPGVLFDVPDSKFTWFNDRSCQILDFFFPTGHGAKRFSSNLTVKDKLAEPWALGIAHPHSLKVVVPLLFVFQHRPTRVYNCNSDYHQFDFKGRAGHVVVMPLLGPARFERSQLGIKDGQLPKELLEKCRYWAKAMLAYPVACKEEFRVDEEDRLVTIRNRISYVESPNDWKWQPTRLTPVSPTLAMAQEKGFPIQFDRPIEDTGMLTYLGRLKMAQGDELTCTIPMFQHLDSTVAPVRIVGSAKAEKLTRQLKKYLELDPEKNETFGGDDTFYTNNIQDVLHDMRVLAWSTWSLDEGDRKKIAKAMAKRLASFQPKNFRVWREHFSKQTFLAEKEIWQESHGDVTYDYEWYNGMQLAGLWAGMYFLGQPELFRKTMRKNWELVEGLVNYFQIVNDWATASFWTDIPGEFMWMDGFHFGWQGLMGLHRICKEMDKPELADQTAYLASKHAVARWTVWMMTDYVQEAIGKGMSIRGSGGPHDQKVADPGSQIIGGFLEKEGFALSPTYATGNALGNMVPEQYLMYLDDPKIRELVRKGEHVYMPRQVPHWNKKPKVFGYGKGPFPYTSHWHFYMLDDHFFVRSMVLRDPMDEMMKLIPAADYTGPVMESFLVAGAPMVIIPTQAKFAGNVWDARKKRLTIRMDAPTADLELAIIWPAHPRTIENAAASCYDAQAQRLVINLYQGPSEVIVQY